MPDITLYNQDCIKAMSLIEPCSVDLIITDPPYNLSAYMKKRNTNLHNMRENFFVTAGWDDMSYDEWKEHMDSFFAAAATVIKTGGAMIVFMTVMKVETLIQLAVKHGFYYKTTGTWHKTNPMPRNKNLQYINSTETWIYFVYNKKTGTFNNNGKALHDFIETSVAPKRERTFGTHPTQKPEKLIQQFVDVLSNPGECILDPFMGTGVTGVVAERTGRKFIGIELRDDYFAIAKSRIEGNEDATN